ncbi:unnamed protein product, partial [Closterium sp. Yama58-4]
GDKGWLGQLRPRMARWGSAAALEATGAGATGETSTGETRNVNTWVGRWSNSDRSSTCSCSDWTT